MKKILTSLVALAAVISFASCSSAEKMAKQADLVLVQCNPGTLTVKGGNVDVDITVTYPADYFNAKAILEVTPVVVYNGGEEALKPLMYQGTKVANNYTVVPTEGGVVKEHVAFAFKEGMEQCTLELRGRCTTNEGKKWVVLPTKKAADGCNINELLVCACGNFAVKDHGYQEVITFNPEGQVMYNINSAVVRNSEIKGKSVKAFQEAMQEVADNERKTLKGIEVVAYASPDGPEAKNEKLSDNRSKSADKAFQKVAKKDKNLKGVATEVKSVGEDWAGFQELVNNSDLEDKDLILSVLSMYNDANVREKEIRNMSSVFQGLATDVLPQLRRARFIANVEFINYSEAELLQLLKENADLLDEPALLKVATLVKDCKEKEAVYKMAVEKFNSNKAKFDLAVLAMKAGKTDEALKALAGVEKDADVLNLQGVAALRGADYAAAKKLFAAAGTEAAQKNLATVAMKEGDYTTAVKYAGETGKEAALANLLDGNYDKALKALGDCQCPLSNYVRAICLNHQGKVAEAKAALKKACDADAKLAKRAQTDLEVANLL